MSRQSDRYVDQTAGSTENVRSCGPRWVGDGCTAAALACRPSDLALAAGASLMQSLTKFGEPLAYPHLVVVAKAFERLDDFGGQVALPCRAFIQKLINRHRKDVSECKQADQAWKNCTAFKSAYGLDGNIQPFGDLFLSEVSLQPDTRERLAYLSCQFLFFC